MGAAILCRSHPPKLAESFADSLGPQTRTPPNLSDPFALPAASVHAGTLVGYPHFLRELPLF